MHTIRSRRNLLRWETYYGFFPTFWSARSLLCMWKRSLSLTHFHFSPTRHIPVPSHNMVWSLSALDTGLLLFGITEIAIMLPISLKFDRLNLIPHRSWRGCNNYCPGWKYQESNLLAAQSASGPRIQSANILAKGNWTVRSDYSDSVPASERRSLQC